MIENLQSEIDNNFDLNLLFDFLTDIILSINKIEENPLSFEKNMKERLIDPNVYDSLSALADTNKSLSSYKSILNRAEEFLKEDKNQNNSYYNTELGNIEIKIINPSDSVLSKSKNPTIQLLYDSM